MQNIQRTLKIKNKKTTSQIKKWAKDQNRDLIKEKYIDGKQAYENMPNDGSEVHSLPETISDS